MTITLLAPEASIPSTLADTIDSLQAVIVLVSHADTMGECTDTVGRAAQVGALTLTCTVDTTAPWLDAIDQVIDAIDDAIALFPYLPVVLVGHGHAGPIAVLAGEVCRDEISGLVLTKSHDATDWAA